MACLAYNPSPVKYKNSKFGRKEIIEIQKRLLERVHADPSELLDQIAAARPQSISAVRQHRTVSLPSSHRIYQQLLETPDSDLPPLAKRSGSSLIS